MALAPVVEAVALVPRQRQAAEAVEALGQAGQCWRSQCRCPMFSTFRLEYLARGAQPIQAAPDLLPRM